MPKQKILTSLMEEFNLDDSNKPLLINIWLFHVSYRRKKIVDSSYVDLGMGMVHNELVRNVFLSKQEDCLEYLRKLKWKGTVRCSYCCSSDVWNDGFTPKGARKYQCQRCHRYFNDLTGTIFEHHHFPVEEMFYILKEMKVKSTNQISRELDRDYDSVLRFVHEV